MLTVTLVAVCLGTFSIAPGLGILLAILVTPALIRTINVIRRQSSRGGHPNLASKLGTFAASILVVTAIAVAAGATFFATCFVGVMGGMAGSEALGVKYNEFLSYAAVIGILLLSIVASLFVAIVLARRL